MPYVCVRNNIYIGEHTCGKEHYGNMSVVRPCCVADAIYWKNLTIRDAITDEHPNYVMFSCAWNCLTDAEREIVGNILYSRKYGFIDEDDWKRSNMSLEEYSKKERRKYWMKF